MSKPYSEDLRTRVIQSYLNGLSKMDIVTLFKIGMDTLNRWIRQYLQTGDIKPKKRTQFRARKFSDSDLKDYIRNNPSVTLKQIAEHFSVKPSSVQARLKALNITYKKKQFLYEERDEQQRMEFIQQLAANASRGDDAQQIVYVDESGFHNNVRNEFGWSPRGEIIFGERKSRPTEKLNLLGGLLNNEIIAPLAYQSYTDTEIFNTWLEKFLIPELPKNCIIVMDNARFHKSEETREIIEDNGHQLLFLPPYSPDLNPIENYWALLKGKLRKIVANFQNLFDALVAVFQTI